MATIPIACVPSPPEPPALGERERRAWLMLTVQLFGARNCVSCWSCWLPVPITASTPCPGRCRCRCVGVLWHEPSQCDLLFVTLRKSEALFSPTTRTRDLALGPSLFHWESQSTTTAASATGKRYIHHEARGSRVLLFVREQRRQGGVTEPFVCLGFTRYESYEGERIWFVPEWRSAGGWSGRSRRPGCR